MTEANAGGSGMTGPAQNDVSYFAHPQALVESTRVGARTRVWAFAHILPGARLGEDCNICDGVFIENDVTVGHRVTVKNGVQLWDGVTLEDDVFVGPNATFTNDQFPRSRQHGQPLARTTVRRGASIGANATLLPGVEIGEYAMVGAGAVVIADVPPATVVVGNPARMVGEAADGVRETVVGPRLVELPAHPDDRGLLTFAQFDAHIPFVPRRYYALTGMPEDTIRGKHAHRRQHGFCVCLAGGFTMTLDDGHAARSWELDGPSKGLYIPPLQWRILTNFRPGTVVLCLSSGVYDEADYIRDYSEFRRLIASA